MSNTNLKFVPWNLRFNFGFHTGGYAREEKGGKKNPQQLKKTAEPENTHTKFDLKTKWILLKLIFRMK